MPGKQTGSPLITDKPGMNKSHLQSNFMSLISFGHGINKEYLFDLI